MSFGLGRMGVGFGRGGSVGGTGGPQIVGGDTVGEEGSGFYAGYILSWGEEFTSLNIVSPSNPTAKFFPTRAYAAGPRGANSGLLTQYDTDPYHTGHLDSNRGVAVGFDNMSIVSGTKIRLQARKATAGEQDHFSSTSAGSNGGVRNEVSAMIHTAGACVFYPGTSEIIVEAKLRFDPNGGSAFPGGWHPSFWTLSNNPASLFFDAGVANSGDSNELDIFEAGDINKNTWTDGVQSSSNLDTSTGYFDGLDHIHTAIISTTEQSVYVDESLIVTDANNGNTFSKPQYVLLTAHILNGVKAEWDADSDGVYMECDWIKVWRKSTSAHYRPTAASTTLNVAYAGTGSIVLPSAASLWGDGTVNEYVQAIPHEAADPGMGALTTYAQFPAGVTYDSGTRTISVDWSATSGNAGRIHGTVVAWKDGSTCEPYRFTINRGPKITISSFNLEADHSTVHDLYVECDCGTILPKTISVSGLPSGLSFSSSTGLITGTSTAGVTTTCSVTVTNAAGQSVTSDVDIVDSSYDSASLAIFAAFTTPPSTQRKTDIDDLIVALKAGANVWDTIDVLQVYAAADTQAALINFKNPGTFNASLVSAPTFTADTGYTTNGTSNYIDTGFDPSTAGGLFAQNDCSLSVWSLTSGQTSGSAMGLLDGSAIGNSLNVRNTSDQIQYRCQSINSAVSYSNTDGSGFFTINRTSSTANEAFRNGSSLGTNNTQSSATLRSGNIRVGSASAASFAARQYACAVIGKHRTSTQESELYAALRTYMTAVGIP